MGTLAVSQYMYIMLSVRHDSICDFFAVWRKMRNEVNIVVIFR